MQKKDIKFEKRIFEASKFVEEFITNLTGNYNKDIAKGDIDNLLDLAEKYGKLDEYFIFEGKSINFEIDTNIRSFIHQNLLFQDWNRKTQIIDKFSRPQIILPYLQAVKEYEMSVDGEKEILNLLTEDLKYFHKQDLSTQEREIFEYAPWLIQKYIVSSSACGLIIDKDNVGVITINDKYSNTDLKKSIIYSLFNKSHARGNIAVLEKNIMKRKSIV
jgi:hypothetical protein